MLGCLLLAGHGCVGVGRAAPARGTVGSHVWFDSSTGIELEYQTSYYTGGGTTLFPPSCRTWDRSILLTDGSVVCARCPCS